MRARQRVYLIFFKTRRIALLKFKIKIACQRFIFFCESFRSRLYDDAVCQRMQFAGILSPLRNDPLGG